MPSLHDLRMIRSALQELSLLLVLLLLQQGTDSCDPNPCPMINETQVACVQTSEGPVCICPVGLKGPDCTEEDPPLVCRARNKVILFEEDPTIENRTACMPEVNSTAEDPCYNPDEDIVYVFNGTDEISVDNRDLRFCLAWWDNPPTEPTFCVDILAFEEDDRQYRPWINQTFEFCFIFNREPRLDPIPEEPLVFNVPDMPDTWNVRISATDKNINQQLSFSVGAVNPAVMFNQFSMDGENLVIRNPKDLLSQYPEIFLDTTLVEITVVDNGIPQAQDVRNYSIDFTYDEFNCTVSQQLFLVQLPTASSPLSLGKIECYVNGEAASPNFSIKGEFGPLGLHASGEILYNETAPSSRGKFNVVVEANLTTRTQLSRRVTFTVFAEDFSPNCSKTFSDPIRDDFSEKAPTGTCSPVLFVCSDLANLTRTCSDSSSLFNVTCDTNVANRTEVKICSLGSLDQLAGQNEVVSIEVENEYGTSGISADVTITNVNDPPVIRTNETSLQAEVKEDTTPPYTVLTGLIVDDPDVKLSDNLSVSLSDLENKEDAASLPFSATISNDNDITVTLDDKLNPSVRSSFRLQIKITDSDGLFDTVDLNITILDMNEAPVCDPDVIETSAAVTDPVGYVVTRLTCTDPDFTDQYGQASLISILDGDPAVTAYFRINQVGEIAIAQSLSSFNQGTQLSFSVNVTDGGQLMDVVSITVNISSNFPPNCSQYDVSHDITEKTQADQCFTWTVSCSDPVNNENLTFRDFTGNGTQLFALREAESTNENLKFCTTSELDGSVGYWLLTFVVASSYGTRSLQVVFKVQDVNDPPTCSNSSVSVSASVKYRAGQELTRLTCTDTDTEAGYNTLSYLLEGSSDVTDYFEVNQGIITLRKDMSDVRKDTLLFSVKIQDGGNMSTVVSVEVNVATNFPPECGKTNFDIERSEKVAAGDECFEIVTNCRDPVVQETLAFGNFTGNGTQLFNFSSDKSTNERLTFCSTVSLQGRIDQYQLSLNVASSYGATPVEVNVNVTDVNEPPVCSPATISADATVRDIAGLEVARLSCSDPDVQPSFSTLSYTPTGPGDVLAYFSVQNESIILAKDLADFVSADNVLKFTVTVRDGGGLSTAVTVNVNVSNSYPPYCTSYDIPTTITEKKPQTECLDIIVPCQDSVNASGKLLFRLNTEFPGNGTQLFMLKNDTVTGGVITFCPFKSLQGQVGIWAINGDIISKYGERQLRFFITVEDVNDPFVCSETVVFASVSVLDPVGHKVATVTCTDSDVKPEFKSLTYSLNGDVNDRAYFQVDTNGVLSVAKVLYDVTTPDTVLTFSVNVSDGGGISKNIDMKVNVTNDYPPQCASKIYNQTIGESTDADVCFGVQVGCMERVRNETLSYTVSSGNGTAFFRLNSVGSTNSVLSLCTISALQGKYGTYELVINVQSSYGATDIVTIIRVTDRNDPPVFEKNKYAVAVYENTTVGQIVAIVRATDPDSGAFGKVRYYSQEIESSPLFSLNSTSGEISVASILDVDNVDNYTYTFVVQAKDGASVPLSAFTEVVIEVLDVNDEVPVCDPVEVKFSMRLLDPVGSLIWEIGCTDADRTPEYSTIQYISLSPLVAVNSSGHVTLAKPFSRNETEYIIQIKAVDSDRPSDARFTVYLQITIDVDVAVPPVCSPLSTEVTYNETQGKNVCLDKAVICTDPTGGNVVVVSSSGSALDSGLLEVRNTTEPGKLGLSACLISSLKGQIGTFGLSVVVSNLLSQTIISWKLNVLNVNEAPVFTPANYTISIPETYSDRQIPILTLNVSDPDEGKGTTAFELNSVTAIRTNDADFGGALSEPILYVELAKSFFATNTFNATVRNSYKYTVTAVDKSNLNATASVEILITDVNSAPICKPSTVQAATNILVDVGTVIASVNCYDTDLDRQNVRLTYSITSGDSGGYFNMSNIGEVVLVKKLPRDLLYTVGSATLKVLVSDGGTPPLSSSVTVTVQVDNQEGALCNPVVTPPDIWVQNKCVTISMDCTDPTLAGVEHLKYTLTGNYTTGFTVTRNSNGTIELCYNLVTSGIYQISVQVDNGLKAKTFTETIQVSYLQATPVFSQSKYTQTVPETLAANSVVIKVTATSAKIVGSLVYRILGSESTPNWANYFTMKEATGEIMTNSSVKDLANLVFVLRVEVEDTGSKLKSSVQVEVTIQDVNENPTCNIGTTVASLSVDVAVDTTVITFSCSDPDVKEEYKKLGYNLSGTGVSSYFKLVGNPPSSIAVKSPLDVTVGMYTLTLTVSDSAASPLAFTRDFGVNIDRLPPPVELSPVALTYETIQLSWRYVREAYYQVTTGFRVKAFTTSNISVHDSGVLPADTRSYNITSLQAETAYLVFVEAVTNYGSRKSEEFIVGTREIPVLTYFTSTIHAPTTEYSSRLRDTGSQLYFTTKKTVLDNMELVLKDTPGFAGIELKAFRPSNSIYVDTVVAVNQSGSVQNTINKLNQTVASGWLGSLSVDSAYFVASLGAGYIQINSLMVQPPEISNGTLVTLMCNITTVGYQENTSFLYWWTYRGNRLQPTSQSRFTISTVVQPVIYENKQSILKVDPILSQHAGLYGCHISDTASKQVKSKTVEVKVISQPTVIIKPRSATISYGASVNITCELVLKPGIFQGFIWYRNGLLYRDSKDGSVLSETITVTLEESVVFGCEGKNQAGTSTRVLSSIGVIPPDTPDDKLCKASTDSRGTMWPETAPGATARIDCEIGFEGEKYRPCDSSGIWQMPVYDCVRDQIVSIQQEVINIKDGASTKNITVVLNELNGATKDTELFSGDLDYTVSTLDVATEVKEENVPTAESQQQVENFLEVASNLIDEINRPSWISIIEQQQKGAIEIPRLVEKYINTRTEELLQNSTRTFTVKNIHVQIGRGKREKYEFPDRDNNPPAWLADTSTSISIPGEAFKDFPSVHYSNSMYRNISSILVTKLKQNGEVRDISSRLDINSDIVAFQVKEAVGTIDPPARISFHHFDSNYSDPVCCYWDFDEGAFITDGCTLVSTTDDETVCECNHFTNFAVLMSPGKTPPADVLALSIISAIGCGISILCLLITIFLYLLVWRYVKSDRAVLLMNLCVSLILAYVIFLAGVDRVENEAVCTTVSVLLHYVYLVVFFLMLSYGIEIAVSVVYVFTTRSRIRWLLPLAWGLPLIIVGISMGATQLKGYGNESFCWLSVEDGLLWAFVGPAAVVLLVNFVIVIVVLRIMFKSSAMLTKSDKEKAATGVRSLCVLLPILGLTWVFGVFSVNEDLVAFQYVFAICNSLQGFLIFLFHCVFSNQLKQALRQRSERKKSLATLESTMKNQHSTSGSASYVSKDSNKPLQSINKDTDIVTTNPFLEADRQMKEMVANKKKDSNVNSNIDANNKVDIDKGSKAVDLDDVKISNLLRESDAITPGISSILRTDNKNIQDTTELSTSVATAHRYDYIDANPDVPKPPGYERLLQASGHGSSKESIHSREYASNRNSGYSRDSGHYTSSNDNLHKGDTVQTRNSGHSGSDRSKDRQREREKERERAMKQELERERQQKIEKEKRERFEKEKQERERVERENEERERREREKRDREKLEREQRERQRERDRNSGVIRIGLDRDVYKGAGIRIDEVPYDRRRTSRADDDFEAMSSAQNITSISTALPEKFDLYQGKKRQKETKKQADSLKKKDKKKSSLKDRSRAYEYSYESTYLGGNSRHASLESMNMQYGGYSPYAQLSGMGGYQPGRPTQQQHWDPYRYPRDPRNPRDPYARDYW